MDQLRAPASVLEKVFEWKVDLRGLWRTHNKWVRLVRREEQWKLREGRLVRDGLAKLDKVWRTTAVAQSQMGRMGLLLLLLFSKALYIPKLVSRRQASSEILAACDWPEHSALGLRKCP